MHPVFQDFSDETALSHFPPPIRVCDDIVAPGYMLPKEPQIYISESFPRFGGQWEKQLLIGFVRPKKGTRGNDKLHCLLKLFGITFSRGM